MYGAGNVAETKNVFILAYEYHAWDKEISAFKCGDLVGIEFYYDVGGDLVMDSSGPGSSNWKMEESDTAKSLRVKKFPDDKLPATLFNKKGCHGRNHVIKFEHFKTVEYSESGKMYRHPENWHTEDANNLGLWDPASVWL